MTTKLTHPREKPPNCCDPQPIARPINGFALGPGGTITISPSIKKTAEPRKKRERTQKQLIAELLKINKKIQQDVKNYATTAKSVQKAQASLQLTYVKFDKKLEKFRQQFDDIQDCQLNVLSAIRQNEYLQANYHAQQGYPAMKVAGHHPIYTDRKKKTHGKT